MNSDRVVEKNCPINEAIYASQLAGCFIIQLKRVGLWFYAVTGYIEAMSVADFSACPARSFIFIAL